ncbi:MAG: DNA methyltransferase, partial [Chthoniobacteraceae bacterium]
MDSHQSDTASGFIARWKNSGAAERANYQLFLSELCDLIGVARPDPTKPDDADNAYVFERSVTFHHPDGTTSTGRIDLYKRGCYVLEAKQGVEKRAAEEKAEALADATKARAKAAKKGHAQRGSAAWDEAMLKARGQAEQYARALPANEGRPPLLIIVDVGHSIELYSEFTRTGGTYVPFPDPQSHRILLEKLNDADVRETLRLAWTDPQALDPARRSARVTREIAQSLGRLAASLEKSGHRAETVATFLMRALFTMFAEDMELLPKESFLNLLKSLQGHTAQFVPMVEELWGKMKAGGFSTAIREKILCFNGGLFEDATALPLTDDQFALLIEAAHADWREVEPAIFGTLLVRALDPVERHKLGAHYTPRAYVEQLVLPTIIAPLRAEWDAVKAAAFTLDRMGKRKDAIAEVQRFHRRLCDIRVLDPACGTGNFLYVTLAQIKLLEGEVLVALDDLGHDDAVLEMESFTVLPGQFLGLEVNPRAAAIADLVLWIGYLQWHFRTRGRRTPSEPIIRAFHNIQCRDAVLAWDGPPVPQRDAAGAVLTVWDRRSLKKDAITGRDVPDESKTVPLLTYPGARPAAWPEADYIVGNPPFLGNKRMREDLGDGYTEALRAAYPEVPESADFVMYWWHKAAAIVRTGGARRFGLITTNSLRQTFNRRVVEGHLKGNPVALPPPEPSGRPSEAVGHLSEPVGRLSEPVGRLSEPVGRPSEPVGRPSEPVGPSGAAPGSSGEAPSFSGDNRKRAKEAGKTSGDAAPSLKSPVLSLLLAIPDHPWVDTAEGAAVRIAMTVGEAGEHPGEIRTATAEEPQEDGSAKVAFAAQTGRIAADLTTGADVMGAVELKANERLTYRGVQLIGSGFIVSPEQAKELGLGTVPGAEQHIRQYRNGRDLTDSPRDVMCIDLFGLSADEARQRFPAIYQHVLTHVKPEREANNRESYRRNWWIFGEPRRDLRPALAGLPRYIATVETAKHRIFQFLSADVLPDNKLVVIALDDAFHLGVLSSRIHVVFALSRGALLEDRPVYPKTECFDPFPFPACDEAAQARIRALGEELDAHRKRVQAQHPGLSLT